MTASNLTTKVQIQETIDDKWMMLIDSNYYLQVNNIKFLQQFPQASVKIGDNSHFNCIKILEIWDFR